MFISVWITHLTKIKCCFIFPVSIAGVLDGISLWVEAMSTNGSQGLWLTRAASSLHFCVAHKLWIAHTHLHLCSLIFLLSLIVQPSLSLVPQTQQPIPANQLVGPLRGMVTHHQQSLARSLARSLASSTTRGGGHKRVLLAFFFAFFGGGVKQQQFGHIAVHSLEGAASGFRFG